MEAAEIRRAGGMRQAVGTLTIGAAVGALLALLYAPASGRVTRKRIALKFRALRRSATVLRDRAAKRIGYARAWFTERVHGNTNGKRLRHQHAMHHA